MPFKVTENGNALRINEDGVYLFKLTKAKAISHLENVEDEMIIQVEGRRSEGDQVGRKWQIEISGGWEGTKARDEARIRKAEAEIKLGDTGDKAEGHRCCEREVGRSNETTEKAIKKANKRERKEKKRRLYKELSALTKQKEHEANMISLLRLEKKCLDLHSAELTKREHHLQTDLEQMELSRESMKTEILKQKEDIRNQQDALVMEKLEFEVLKIAQSEEARKRNAEILERDREVQEMETRDREDLRILEEQRVLDEAERRRKEVWGVGMKDLNAGVDRLGAFEGDASAELEMNQSIGQKLEEVKAMLMQLGADAECVMKVDDTINSLITEHDAEQNTVQVEQEISLEDAQVEGQELHLRFRMVEEDLERDRERNRHAESIENKEVVKASNGDDLLQDSDSDRTH